MWTGTSYGDLQVRARSSNRESLRSRSQVGNSALRGGLFNRELLSDPGFRDADGELPHARDDADAFSDADGAASIQQVEDVRAFQRSIVGGEHGEALAIFCFRE